MTIFASIPEASDHVEGSFDLITLWHSLEHIFDVDTAMTRVVRLLAPSGRVIVAVPNCQSADAAHYRARWAGYEVPRHLHHFTALGIERLSERNGLAVTRIEPLLRDTFHAAIRSEVGSQVGRLAWGSMKGLWFVLGAIRDPLVASSLAFTMRRR
jgi:hypothetical protein